MKKRWQDPAYRERYTLANRGNRNHSDETKAKISAAIKAKWEDKEYRAKVNILHRPSQDVRNRISQTLKKKWQDPVPPEDAEELPREERRVEAQGERQDQGAVEGPRVPL